jgi:hypothetical protein
MDARIFIMGNREENQKPHFSRKERARNGAPGSGLPFRKYSNNPRKMMRSLRLGRKMESKLLHRVQAAQRWKNFPGIRNAQNCS